MKTSSIWAKIPGTFLQKCCAILFWLLLWAIAAHVVGREILLAAPHTVLLRLFALMQEASFWRAVLHTFQSVFWGFSLALVFGALFAVMTHHLRLARFLFEPLLGVIRAMPVASMILLALVWLPTARIPAVIIFLMIFPITWTNLYTAFSSVDADLLEMAGVFHLGRFQHVRYVYLPAFMPHIIAALTTGLGAAWKTAIGAEVIARPAQTMGRAIYDARIHLQTADLFAWTIAVIVISILLERLMLRALSRMQQRLSGTKGGVSCASN